MGTARARSPPHEARRARAAQRSCASHGHGAACSAQCVCGSAAPVSRVPRRAAPRTRRRTGTCDRAAVSRSDAPATRRARHLRRRRRCSTRRLTHETAARQRAARLRSRCDRSCAMRRSSSRASRVAGARSTAGSRGIAHAVATQFQRASSKRSQSSAAAPTVVSAQRARRVRHAHCVWQRGRARDVKPRWHLRERDGRTPWPVAGDVALRIGHRTRPGACGAEIFPLTGPSDANRTTLAARAADGEILISEEMRARSVSASMRSRASSARPAQPNVSRRVEPQAPAQRDRPPARATVRRPSAGARDDPGGARPMHDQQATAARSSCAAKPASARPRWSKPCAPRRASAA